MIDLHCHMLPGIDDGAPDLATSLEMARIAVADGIRIVACTPHIYPGMYENTAAGIRQAVARFQEELDGAGIDLKLVVGADTHLVPGLPDRLREGTVPTIADSRYLLLEPPHHVAPPGFEQQVFNLMAAGYVPVITHPERLTWVGEHYDSFVRLARGGAWMQITAGSLTGRFGGDARYFGERMLDEALVHILATDSHGVRGRPPLLAEGRKAAERWVGAEEASRLVESRPRSILDNIPASGVPAPLPKNKRPRTKGFLSRLFGGR